MTMPQSSWARGIMEKLSWRRHHGGGIMEEISWRMQASWRRHHGGGIWRRHLEEASWIDQSISQSVSQSINQSINESIKIILSFNRSASQSVNETINFGALGRSLRAIWELSGSSLSLLGPRGGQETIWTKKRSSITKHS